MAAVFFRNRRVVIGYKGNTYAKNDPYRRKFNRAIVLATNPFHFYFVAETRMASSPNWYDSVPDPEGTTTLIKYSTRNVMSLIKTMHARHFYCPSQWSYHMDSRYPVPYELWIEAVEQAKECLLRFLISFMAHRMYWGEMAKIKNPELRLQNYDAPKVLEVYGPLAMQYLIADRAIGIEGWCTDDGCDSIISKFKKEVIEHRRREVT